MSDGEGCRCAARSESECGCDADWTPQELIDARAEIERLRQFGRLTRGERRALEFAIGVYPLDDSIPDTLRALLERLG